MTSALEEASAAWVSDAPDDGLRSDEDESELASLEEEEDIDSDDSESINEDQVLPTNAEAGDEASYVNRPISKEVCCCFVCLCGLFDLWYDYTHNAYGCYVIRNKCF